MYQEHYNIVHFKLKECGAGVGNILFPQNKLKLTYTKCIRNYNMTHTMCDEHTRIYPQTFHPTLAPMTEHGHQNLSLMNEKLKFLHIYTRCFLDGIIPIQNNSTPFSSVLNYETLNHTSVKEKDL